MNSFYHSDSSGEDNEVEEFEISGRGLNQSSDSDDDNWAEEYQMTGQAFNDFGKKSLGSQYHSDSSGEDNVALDEFELAGQAFNDFEKSERLMPLKFRREKGILKDYAQLRYHLLRKGTSLEDVDRGVDIAVGKKKFVWKNVKKGQSVFGDGNPDLIHPADLTNGATRKAQPL